jgi:hypothetical protein
MDRKEWKNSYELLKNLLKQKKEDLKRMERDIEELNYTLECYKKKI